MNLKTKQRVIGGLVLLALVAIFSPILFHHNKSSEQINLPTKIPPAPNQPTVDLQLPSPNKKELQQATVPPQVSQAVKQSPSKSSAPENKSESDIQPKNIAKSNATNKVNKKPKEIISVTSVPVAWVIQLGSFADKNNAEHLVKKLQIEGFDTYLKVKKEKNGKELTKVFIGPEINFKKIEQIRSNLSKKFKLNGVIKRYQL